MGVTPAAEEAAAELYVTDASDADLAKAEALPKSSSDAELYELEPGRHVPPNCSCGISAAWMAAPGPQDAVRTTPVTARAIARHPRMSADLSPENGCPATERSSRRANCGQSGPGISTAGESSPRKPRSWSATQPGAIFSASRRAPPPDR